MANRFATGSFLRRTRKRAYASWHMLFDREQLHNLSLDTIPGLETNSAVTTAGAAVAVLLLLGQQLLLYNGCLQLSVMMMLVQTMLHFWNGCVVLKDAIYWLPLTHWLGRTRTANGQTFALHWLPDWTTHLVWQYTTHTICFSRCYCWCWSWWWWGGAFGRTLTDWVVFTLLAIFALAITKFRQCRCCWWTRKRPIPSPQQSLPIRWWLLVGRG